MCVPCKDVHVATQQCCMQGQSKDIRKKRKEGNMDMEVTFIPGLKGLGARLLAQKQDASKRKGDTVWEAYLQRRK